MVTAIRATVIQVMAIRATAIRATATATTMAAGPSSIWTRCPTAAAAWEARSGVVETKAGNNWMPVAGPQVIQPLDSFAFLLPDNHQEGSGLQAGGAYRVTSNEPVVA